MTVEKSQKCYISRIWGEPPPNRSTPKLHVGWCPGYNHVFQVSDQNFEGLRFYGGVEIFIFPLIFEWPLQRCTVIATLQFNNNYLSPIAVWSCDPASSRGRRKQVDGIFLIEGHSCWLDTTSMAIWFFLDPKVHVQPWLNDSWTIIRNSSATMVILPWYFWIGKVSYSHFDIITSYQRVTNHVATFISVCRIWTLIEQWSDFWT